MNDPRFPSGGQPPVHEFSQEERRYVVGSGTEIAAILRDLAHRAAQITAYGAADEFILTSVVDVDNARGEFTFEAAPQEARTRKLLESPRITFVASVDGIRIKFSTDGALHAERRGPSEVAAPLPSALMRAQRREYYRLAMPIARPVKCCIPFVRGGHKGWLELTVADLSCGGIALISPPEEFVSEPGVRYPCTVALPGIGTVQATLELRGVMEITTPAGRRQLRSGYEFVGFGGSASSMIQRYIMTMQGGRNARR